MLNSKQDQKFPISELLKGMKVNIHITGKCNHNCKYCFSRYPGVKEKLPVDWISILHKLHDTGIKAVNYSGGEPLLYSGIERLLHYSKKLGFITSISTNGSLLSDDWLRNNLLALDMIGLSINPSNKKIVKIVVYKIKKISKELNHKVHLKINYVVTRENIDDNVTPFLTELKPDRIKFLQFCEVKGENDSVAENLSINKQEFSGYVAKMSALFKGKRTTVSAETDDILNNSYLILNPEARFCDKRGGENKFSPSLVEVDVQEGLNSLYSRTDLYLLRENMEKRRDNI